MCSLIENDSVNALYQKAMNGYGKTLPLIILTIQACRRQEGTPNKAW